MVEEVLQGDSKFNLLDCRIELQRLRSDGELATDNLDLLLDEKYLRTVPGVHPCDGFFAALWERQS